MFKGLIAALSVICLVGVATASELSGTPGAGYLGPEIRPEMIYQGDLIPENGIGCSNPTGTSGGPNDVSVGVVAGLAPPFCLTSHFYNIYTQISPNITALTFSLRTGMVAPGTEIGSQAGLPWTQGSHTVAISPPLTVPSAWFFFGHGQPQSNVGMRWGLDTTTSAGTSYIRAPACGAVVFTLVDQLGFPGNWCMSVSADAGSPVELQSWGGVKALFQ
jgi:hypothetical protein